MSPRPSALARLASLLPPCLAGLAAAAEVPELAAMPYPGIVEVRTLGYWEREDGRGGDIRLVAVDSGLEEPRISQAIVWSLRDFDERSFENVAAATLPDCAGDALGQAQVLSALQTDIDGPVYLAVLPLLPDDPRDPPAPTRPLHYEIGAAGEVALDAGCP